MYSEVFICKGKYYTKTKFTVMEKDTYAEVFHICCLKEI